MSQEMPGAASSVPSPGGVGAERENLDPAGVKGACAGEATPNDVFREVFASSPIGLAVLTPTLHWLEVNDYLLDIFGLDRQELAGLRLRRLLRRYRLAGAMTIIRRLAAGDAGPFTLPARLTRPDGEMREAEARIRRLPLKCAAMDLILLEVRDLTVEAELMRAARGSAVFLRQVIDLIPHFVFAKDEAGRFLLANRAVAEAYGTSSIHILGKTDWHFSTDESEVRAFIADDSEVIRSGRPKVIPEERITTAGGDTRLLQTTKIPFTFGATNETGILGVSVDITELRRTEEELRRRTEELDHFFSVALDLLCIADTDGIFHRVNREWERLLGYAQSDLEGRRFLDFVHPDDREATLAAVERLRQQERVLDFVNRYRRRDGTYRYLEWRSIPVGRRIFAAARDITDRIRTEEVLRTSRQMLQNVLDHFPGVVFWKDTHSVYMGCNRAFAAAAGLDRPEEIVGKTDLELPWANTEAESYVRDDREVMETGSAKLGIIETQHRADGRVLWFSTNKIPLVDANGKVYGVLGTAADITEMRKLEEQYRHAQRMEAVGQLAGGVAHDFNNLLQIITGFLELAQLKLAAAQNADRELDEIRRATERASTLVRQLLTFSRRQAVRCEPVDLDTLIAGLSGMLRRLIDERVDLRIVSHGHLPKVLADPGQLEQVIVNLCVNARDAMPMGGRLVLETSIERLDHSRPQTDAYPGTYAVLSVADSGHGIPPSTWTASSIHSLPPRKWARARGWGWPRFTASSNNTRASLRWRAPSSRVRCFGSFFRQSRGGRMAPLTNQRVPLPPAAASRPSSWPRTIRRCVS